MEIDVHAVEWVEEPLSMDVYVGRGVFLVVSAGAKGAVEEGLAGEASRVSDGK